MTKYIAYAVIKSENGEFTEDIEVTSKARAEQEWEETVSYFNRTLKPGESKREFVRLDRVEEIEVPDLPDDDDDLDDYPDDEWDNEPWDEEDSW